MFASQTVGVSRPHMQGCLLSMGEPGLPTSVGPLSRTVLDNGAWIDHQQGWLPGSDAWFDSLAEGLAWQHANRTMFDKIVAVPRLIWSAPGADDASPSTELEIVERCQRLATVLADYYQRPLPRLHANLYRNGDDSVAWHRDKVASPSDSLVAIVSLGSARAFTVRPFGGGSVQRFDLGRGDLLVMGGTAQQHFEHAIPKAAVAAARISVMIRS